jgi:anti-anti-sigma regulatory factor
MTHGDLPAPRASGEAPGHGYHERGAGVSRGRPLRIEPLVDRTGLRVIGEVDLSGWDVWRSSLASVTGAADPVDDVHLDLTALRFIDTEGVSILVRAAGRLGEERKIVLYEPPAVFHWITELLWPDHPLDVQAAPA